MTEPAAVLLVDELSHQLAELFDSSGVGHCVRIDDLDEELCVKLATHCALSLKGVAVHVLRLNPQQEHDVRPEKAIEIRNRKARSCLLLVPTGEGHAASSLDNSFQRLPTVTLFARVEQSLEGRISDAIVADVLKGHRRMLRGRHLESWAEFLAELCVAPSLHVLGENLWRVGLTPDFGPDPQSRLLRNQTATAQLSRPGRPTASIDDRFTAAGLQDGPWRGALRRFFEQRGALLANPRRWGELIAREHPDLAFDKWKLTETVEEDLEVLTIEPFTKPDGSVNKASKLGMGEDGQLLLNVPKDGTAPLTVRWKTDPPTVAGVGQWKVEVLPPDDLRTEESEPLASMLVKAGNRRCTLKVSVDEDALSSGTRFVVAITALGEQGELIRLSGGDIATVDSQEFQVQSTEEVEPRVRRKATNSLPEAIVRAALEGVDDLTEDLVTWDLAGQVFGLRVGSRRGIQVRVCDALVKAQRELTVTPAQPKYISASAMYGLPIDPAAWSAVPVVLPPALSKIRTEFLQAVASRSPRDTGESLNWDQELRATAQSYLAGYRRALDAAGPEGVSSLLLTDTISLTVILNNYRVKAVVMLPMHPLRIGWLSEHDEVLGAWAQQLTEVTPRSKRTSMLDPALLAQVIPANLPFTVINNEQEVAVYTEELTFGSGLYLVPGSMDTEAAAEAVCSVLGLTRTTAPLQATSHLLAERLRAYEASHHPGGSMRVLSLNPGAGELVADALGEPLGRGNGDGADQAADPHRLDVVCYSASTAFVRPVPALADLQSRVRALDLDGGFSHLFPPISLSVRTLDRFLEESALAHIAIVQDIGDTETDFGEPADRSVSFRNLLIPLVTQPFTRSGDLVWESVPSTGSNGARSDADLAGVHRSHQRAIGRLKGRSDGSVPVVQAVLDGDRQARIRNAHQRADWVIGVDRFIGVDLYESGGVAGLDGSYILDYAPDFVEGIGDRLTVTTSQRAEVERLLEGAMRELDLANVEESVGGVLSTLAVVSGRLALRLLENTSLAREAVSLAAVIAHLRDRGDLEGLIVVPVDAHPEIFGPTGREEGSARRCDLILVRLGQRSFKIECVEVKSRKEARIPTALAEQIVDQVTDTKRLLESRFFAAEPVRVDLELQRARLSSLLHYYADRSAGHGLISPARLPEIHRYIDRVDESGEPAEISMRGYVISLSGDHGFQKRYGDVPVSVLTADDLARIGFTTRSLEPSLAAAAAAAHDSLTPDETEFKSHLLRVDLGGRASDLPAEPRSLEPDSDFGHSPSAAGSAPGQISPLPAVDAGSVTTDRDGGDAAALGEDRQAARDAPDSEGDTSETIGVASNPNPHRPEEVQVELGQDAGGSAVHWRLSTKGSPHGFIVGIPGQGKSVTTRKIIRDFGGQGLPSLVFDFHGDMASDPPEGARVLNAAEGLPFSPFEPDVGKGRPINTTAWEIAEVIGYVANLGEIQRNHVYKALVNAYAEHGWVKTELGEDLPSMDEFSQAVEEVEAGAKGRNARDRLRPFTDFGLFAESAQGRFNILDGARGLVIDVSQIGLEEVQRFAASFLLRRIYREMFSWGRDATLKLAVVLDEAHRLSRDVTLPKIMKEGRKYGAGVIVASQSADDFHSDVLGNAGAKIIFRTNYPASKGVAGFLRGRGGLELSQEIEKLGVGVAFVSTPDATAARKVYMSK